MLQAPPPLPFFIYSLRGCTFRFQPSPYIAELVDYLYKNLPHISVRSVQSQADDVEADSLEFKDGIEFIRSRFMN